MVWLLKQQCDSGNPNLEEACGAAGVPSLEVLTIAPSRGSSSSFNIEGKLTQDSPDAIRIDTIPLSEASLAKRLPKILTRGPAIQFTINDDADVLALVGVSSATRFRVPYGYLSRRASAQDGCRWSSKPCPAANGERLFVRGLKIHPCLSGGSIGAVGSHLQDIRAGAASMLRLEKDRRGCDTCSAEPRCSKCLFTGPFDVESFCSVQRQNPALASLVDALALGRALLDAKDDPLRKDDYVVQSLCMLDNRVTVSGATIPLSSCFLFFAENSDYGFLHSPKFELVSKLTTDQRIAIESLI
jgi:hypothetical protein